MVPYGVLRGAVYGLYAAITNEVNSSIMPVTEHSNGTI